MILGPVALGLSVGFRAIGVTHTQLAEHGHCEQLLIGSPVYGGNELRDTGFGVLSVTQRRCQPGSSAENLFERYDVLPGVSGDSIQLATGPSKCLHQLHQSSGRTMDTLASIGVLEPGVVQFSVRFFTYSKPLGSYPDTRSLSAANEVEEAMADGPTGTRILGAFCVTLAFAIAAHIGAALGQPQLKNEPQAGLASAARPEGVAGDVLQRIDLRVSLLHAGAEASDVERVLGRPTTTTVIEQSPGDKRALVYAEAPVRTQVLLTDGRVTAIALDLPHIDITLLPAHARMVKPMMMRAGVLALLGRPNADERWTVSGRAIEQMMFARAGQADFSVFLADGLVVDVRPGAERPPNILQVVLPAAIPDASVGSDLSIGLNPNQAAPLLGPAAWAATTSTFKGQPVLHATHFERDGHRLVSLTFTGGALTAFAIWPPGAALDLADTCCSAAR